MHRIAIILLGIVLGIFFGGCSRTPSNTGYTYDSNQANPLNTPGSLSPQSNPFQQASLPGATGTSTMAAVSYDKPFVVSENGQAQDQLTPYLNGLSGALGGSVPPSGFVSSLSDLYSSNGLQAALAGLLTSDWYARNQISKWYIDYLHRLPESEAAVNGWLQVFHSSGSDAVQAGILGSDEYYQLAGATTLGFLTHLYSDLLHRGPDDYGLNSWTTQLNSGTSRLQVAEGFLTSNEYKMDHVADLYPTLTGAPISPAEENLWSSVLQSNPNYNTNLATLRLAGGAPSIGYFLQPGN